ncbi:MAG: competence/damage-inducible protein A [Bacteroidales bacterium]|nr:competence/damage-inducible protein A [Bacteroidales bacterium]
MRVAIITIGDEILIGQITDTNSVWLAQKLTDLRIRTTEMVSISDTAEQIMETLDRFIGKYDLVLMTGGLGPTNDDITKHTLARYFGGEMVMNTEVLCRIEEFFMARGRKLIESNRLQALVPESCEPLINVHGTAPGMWFEKAGTVLISLPGVPYEMKGIMEGQVISRLRERYKIPEIAHKTIMTQGLPESYLAEMIRDWESALPPCVKLAYLPRPGLVRLRLTATGKPAKDIQPLFQSLIDELLKLISVYVYGFDDVSVEEVLGDELRKRGLSIAVAESCTGGNIARLITHVPGCSDYFRGGMVAYHNGIKVRELGVDPEILRVKGAVSREVVEQMVRGIMKNFGTDTGIATSGVAGPSGGTDGKPIGTTWISVAWGDKIHTGKHIFGGNRERIIEQASLTAVNLLRRLVIGTL